MTKMVKTSGCLMNVNGNTASKCPLETGVSISDCAYGEYANLVTKKCIPCYASCRTCTDAYYNKCYSCIVSPGVWEFDYINICSSTCGDGVKDDFESCEDGNIIDGDGCSSICDTESGYSCTGGSFSNVDTC